MSDMIKKRVLAFLVDYFCLCILGTLVFMIIFYDRELDKTFVIGFSVWCIIGTLLKDVFGQSLGKRIGKIKITTQDGNKPPIYKLLLRNITVCIWPLELIAAMISESDTRISDKLLGLRVVKA